MIEQFHDRERPIPRTLCEKCGERCKNQELTLTLERPRLTRTFKFCSLICIRKWVAHV